MVFLTRYICFVLHTDGSEGFIEGKELLLSSKRKDEDNYEIGATIFFYT